MVSIGAGDDGWMLTNSAFTLLVVLDGTMDLRGDESTEIEGLDYSEHGEEGYILLKSRSKNCRQMQGDSARGRHVLWFS